VKSSILWDTGLKLKVSQFATCFPVGFLVSSFFSPEDGSICSSEMSVDFQRTGSSYIPLDRTDWKQLHPTRQNALEAVTSH
jgi:hypothetical protein